MLFLPESPRFYLSQGRDDLALEILQNMYMENHPKSTPEQFAVKRFIPEDGEKEKGTQPSGFLAVLENIWNQTVPLFKRPNLLYFVVCCTLQFGMFFV